MAYQHRIPATSSLVYLPTLEAWVLAPLMVTPEQHARGLVGHPPLKLGHGMLFKFERKEPVAMTMVGVEYPIDMIFCSEVERSSRAAYASRGSELRIEAIARRVAPGTERVSGPSVEWVLEVPAGFADLLDEGDAIFV